MRSLFLCFLFVPLAAAAETAIEAVGVQQLTGLENTYPAWSADGTLIVFESTRDGPDADIFKMNADGTEVRQLSDNEVYDGTPVFTPDGQFIVYASEQDGNLEIFRMRADGSERTNLSRHPGADGHPKLSADGSRIFFNSNRASDPSSFTRGTMDREHNHEIYSMTLDGEDVRRHTELPDWDTYPAISPDGRQIAFASNRASSEFDAFDIYVANADGSNLTRVTFGDGAAGRGSWTKPVFSADGKRILCTRTVGTSVDIFVVRLR